MREDWRNVMKKLTLTNHAQEKTTVLENEFIDHYMAEANGEYVKVYLLLLRHLNSPDGSLSVSRIADILDDTEKDVIRALNYWKKQGLLDFEPTDLTAAPSAEQAVNKAASEEALPVPGKSAAGSASEPATAAPAQNIQPYRNRREREEFKELLFVAEQYLGKTLSATEIDTITYFYDTLHMSTDLIEYLIEYCVENGHKSMHYIQKVALAWAEQKISTVAGAKANTVLYNKNCYSVLNAYGIKGRVPASSEITFIRRWNEEYGFSLELILEACSRTMNTIHQPSFDYTESILKSWLAKGVKHLEDVEALDAEYLLEKERKKKKDKNAAAPSGAKNNKFNNFEGRNYDMNDLERKLVQ